MPLFEYQCRECKSRFEAFVVAGRRPEACPSCGGTDLEKQFSTFGLGGSTGGAGAGTSWGTSCGPTGGG